MNEDNDKTTVQSLPKLLTDESTKYKGPGWQLRTAREAAQIGIGDVARQLRLSVDMVAAIERDDYSQMAGLTFTRGYLRGYARVLNIPGDEILIAFDRLGVPEKTPQLGLNVYGVKEPTISESTIRTITIGVIAAIIVLVVIWWHTQSSNSAAQQAAAAKAKPAPTSTVNNPNAGQAALPTPVPQTSPPAASAQNNLQTPSSNQMGVQVPAQPSVPQSANGDAGQAATDETNTSDEDVTATNPQPVVKTHANAKHRRMPPSSAKAVNSNDD